MVDDTGETTTLIGIKTGTELCASFNPQGCSEERHSSIHKFHLFRLGLALVVLGIGFFSTSLRAEEIKFPDEELARESVLPIFDRPDSVQNRVVKTAGRFELGAFGGWTMTDPFFNQLSLGGMASYHFSEVHGINFAFSSRLEGASSYSEQLNSVKGKAPLHLEYAPQTKFVGLANYQFTGFYGKISVSKQTVANISTFGLLGGGVVGIGETTNAALDFGLGQKYYLGRDFALRLDLLVLLYQGPDLLSPSVNLSGANASVSASSFPKKTYIDTMFTLGGVYLIPGS